MGTLIFGPTLYLVYAWLTSNGYITPLALAGSRARLAELLASFSFTMLGFLATLITILFMTSDSDVMRKYRRGGYHKVLVSLLAGALVSLSVTFVAAIVAAADHTPVVWFQVSISMAFSGMVQVVLTALATLNLARKG